MLFFIIFLCLCCILIFVLLLFFKTRDTKELSVEFFNFFKIYVKKKRAKKISKK